MPPTKRRRGGWTIPGYNYCGPFNDVSDADLVEAVNDLDECCKIHDQHYDLHTKDLDTTRS